MFETLTQFCSLSDPSFNASDKSSADFTKVKKGVLGATTDAHRFPVQFLSFRPPTLFMADHAVRATYGREAA